MKTTALVFLAAIAITIAKASAQYTMDWHSMDGGVGSGTAGAYEMRGTLGQPDAFSRAAGATELRGGFWSLPDGELPALRIFVFNGDVILAWQKPAAGFVLQESPDLTKPTWADVPDPPMLVGGEWMLNWGPPDKRHFFRLRRP